MSDAPVTLSWSEVLPSDASQVGLGAADIRKTISETARGLGVSLYWPGAGGASANSAGLLKPGAGQPYFDASSRLSSSAGTGRLYVDSSNTRLYLTSPKILLGGPNFYEVGSLVSSAEGVWLEQWGQVLAVSVPSVLTVTFPSTYLEEPITLQLSSWITGTRFAISALTEGGFAAQVDTSIYGGTESATTVSWRALGEHHWDIGNATDDLGGGPPPP